MLGQQFRFIPPIFQRSDMRLLALVCAALLALTPPAARADYLNAPEALAQGWAALLARLPQDAEVMQIQILPDTIDAIIRTGAGQLDMAQFTVAPFETKQGHVHRVEGPEPSLTDFRQGFRLSDATGPDAIAALMAAARAALKLGSEAEFSYLLLGQMPAAGDGPRTLSVILDAETPRYQGSIELTVEGRVTDIALAPTARPQTPGSPAPAPSTPAPPVATAPIAATPAPAPAPPPAAPFRGDSGVDLVAGLAAFAERLGPDTPIWEVDARPDRISIDRPHPTQAGTVAILTLTAQGFRDERSFPRMMQTEADLFPLSALNTLTPQAIDAARNAGLAAVAIPGGELERLRLWSGAPFWRHPAGEPFFDIRVGVPPGGRPNGYAVVTLGGQVVEAIR